MNHKKIFKNTNWLIIVSLSLAFWGFISSPKPSLADISTDSYCQLTLQLMQQETSDFQELIALVKQYPNDPEGLAQQEEIKRAASDQAKNALFSSFGTTAEEYVTYMGKNGQAVNTYLEENQEIKQQIADLTSQISTLMNEYETLKESVIHSEPPLP